MASIENLKHALLVELISEIKKIPYCCGNPACFAPGCLALRRAKEIIRELKNDARFPPDENE